MTPSFITELWQQSRVRVCARACFVCVCEGGVVWGTDRQPAACWSCAGARKERVVPLPLSLSLKRTCAQPRALPSLKGTTHWHQHAISLGSARILREARDLCDALMRAHARIPPPLPPPPPPPASFIISVHWCWQLYRAPSLQKRAVCCGSRLQKEKHACSLHVFTQTLCVCECARLCVSACWGFTVNWRRLLSFYHKSHNGPVCLYKTKCFVFLFVFLVKHFIKVLFQRRVNMNLSFGVGIFLRALKAAFHSKMRTCLKCVSIDPLRAVNFILNLASKFYKKIWNVLLSSFWNNVLGLFAELIRAFTVKKQGKRTESLFFVFIYLFIFISDLFKKQKMC